MNNDLISRDALKKEFDDYIKANPNCGYDTSKEIEE